MLKLTLVYWELDSPWFIIINKLFITISWLLCIHDTLSTNHIPSPNTVIYHHCCHHKQPPAWFVETPSSQLDPPLNTLGPWAGPPDSHPRVGHWDVSTSSLDTSAPAPMVRSLRGWAQGQTNQCSCGGKKMIGPSIWCVFLWWEWSWHRWLVSKPQKKHIRWTSGCQTDHHPQLWLRI